SITDPKGNQILYQYSAEGDLIAVTDRNSKTTTIVYNSTRSHYLDHIVGPTGVTALQVTYDLTSGRFIGFTDAQGHLVNISSDPNAQTQTWTDQLGLQTTYTFDADGNTLQTAYPDGTVVVNTYDANDNLLTQTDPYNPSVPGDPVYTVTMTYDDSGNLL